MKLLRLFLIFFSAAFFACHAPKALQVEIPGDHIEFGYVNQKTAAHSAYILLRDGSLFQKNAIDAKSTLVKKISQKDADFVYTVVARLKSGNSSLYQIGEETIFVRIRQNNTLVQEWKWNMGNEELASDMKQMERLMMDIMDYRRQ
ncbi:MAG: hypothetical protein ACOVP1_11595 [Bacteroidia bacterium]